MAIHKNFVDLIDPFRQKMVYMPEMNGSFSIKHVLPALAMVKIWEKLKSIINNKES